MNAEQIELFLQKKVTEKSPYVKISFQKREAIYGLFLKERDYQDLSRKNFWRIVTQRNFDAYRQTKDAGLARIFNGSEMTRLSPLAEEFDK